MVTGVVLFALVVHFLIRPAASMPALPAMAARALLAAALAVTAAGYVLRQRVPQRSTDESADPFWQTATPLALVTWAVFEAGCLIPVIVYMLTGAASALVVGAIGLVAFISVNPSYLERRR